MQSSPSLAFLQGWGQPIYEKISKFLLLSTWSFCNFFRQKLSNEWSHFLCSQHEDKSTITIINVSITTLVRQFYNPKMLIGYIPNSACCAKIPVELIGRRAPDLCAGWPTDGKQAQKTMAQITVGQMYTKTNLSP